MGSFTTAVVYVALVVGYFHGLIYSASHAMWTWFVIGMAFPPISIVIGLFTFLS